MTGRVVIYSAGILMSSVCAGASMTIIEVEDEVNLISPTGVGPWQLSNDETFKSGEPNPCPCDSEPNRTHWLLEC